MKENNIEKLKIQLSKQEKDILDVITEVNDSLINKEKIIDNRKTFYRYYELSGNFITENNFWDSHNFTGKIEKHSSTGITSFFFKNGISHRDDNLPAIIYSDMSEEYFKDGKHHRENGPARIIKNVSQEYWLNNKQYSKEEFDKIINKPKKNNFKEAANRIMARKISKLIASNSKINIKLLPVINIAVASMLCQIEKLNKIGEQMRIDAMTEGIEIVIDKFLQYKKNEQKEIIFVTESMNDNKILL